VTPVPLELVATLAPRIKELVEAQRDDILKTSVEEAIPVLPLIGPSCTAFYFSATDSEVKPGGWAFITHGMLSAYGRLFHFTVLSHIAPPRGAAEGMNILATLMVIPPNRFTQRV